MPSSFIFLVDMFTRLCTDPQKKLATSVHERKTSIYLFDMKAFYCVFVNTTISCCALVKIRNLPWVIIARFIEWFVWLKSEFVCQFLVSLYGKKWQVFVLWVHLFPEIRKQCLLDFHITFHAMLRIHYVSAYWIYV